jgi:hypothetical protein
MPASFASGAANKEPRLPLQVGVTAPFATLVNV